jgi:hypothetical protein
MPRYGRALVIAAEAMDPILTLVSPPCNIRKHAFSQLAG